MLQRGGLAAKRGIGQAKTPSGRNNIAFHIPYNHEDENPLPNSPAGRSRRSTSVFDFAPKHIDHTCLSAMASKVVSDARFEGLIFSCIIVTSLSMGIQTYSLPDNATTVLVYLEAIILAMFTLEVVLKIFAKGKKPWRYFIGDPHHHVGSRKKKLTWARRIRRIKHSRDWGSAGWNVFDFLIVLFSLLPLDLNIAQMRLLRLLRMGKIVKELPELHMIIVGLVGGLQAMVYIILLLFIVFYVYACAGTLWFKENDPWHMGTLPQTLLTLWRAATLEDWTDLMYLNAYGCDVYEDVYVLPAAATALTPAVCASPAARWYLSPLFFVSFVVVASFVLLSLFIGAITLSMTESFELEDARREQKAHRRRLERQRKRIEYQENMKSLRFITKKLKEQQAGEEGASEGAAAAHARRQLRELRELALRRSCPGLVRAAVARAGAWGRRARATVEQAWDQNSLRLLTAQAIDASLLMQVRRAVSLADMEERNMIRTFMRAAYSGTPVTLDQSQMTAFLKHLSPILKSYYILSLKCIRLSQSHWFKGALNFTVGFSSVLTGVETFDLPPGLQTAMDWLDYVIVAVFTFEAAVKIVATNFRPHRYFMVAWNQLDFVIVVASYVGFLPFVANQEEGGDAATILRLLLLLRALRVLKLINLLPQLQIIVLSLLKGVKSIGYIMAVCLLVFYVFAYVGVLAFAGNDPWHFGSLHTAMLTLFRCATLEDWTDVMYTNIYGCDQYGYDGDMDPGCTAPEALGWRAVLYFCVFVLVGAQVLLTLFVGVVSSSMNRTGARLKEKLKMRERLLALQAAHGLSDLQVHLCRRAYATIDLDGSGGVGMHEFLLGFRSMGIQGMRPKMVRKIIQEVDTDKDDYINEAEFLELMIKIQQWHMKTDSVYQLEPNQALVAKVLAAGQPDKHLHAKLDHALATAHARGSREASRSRSLSRATRAALRFRLLPRVLGGGRRRRRPPRPLPAEGDEGGYRAEGEEEGGGGGGPLGAKPGLGNGLWPKGRGSIVVPTSAQLEVQLQPGGVGGEVPGEMKMADPDFDEGGGHSAALDQPATTSRARSFMPASVRYMSAAISRRKKKGIARAGSTQGSSGRLRRASLQSLKTARPHRLFIRAGEGAATLFAIYFHDSSSSSSSSSESDEEGQ